MSQPPAQYRGTSTALASGSRGYALGTGPDWSSTATSRYGIYASRAAGCRASSTSNWRTGTTGSPTSRSRGAGSTTRSSTAMPRCRRWNPRSGRCSRRCGGRFSSTVPAATWRRGRAMTAGSSSSSCGAPR